MAKASEYLHTEYPQPGLWGSYSHDPGSKARRRTEGLSFWLLEQTCCAWRGLHPLGFKQSSTGPQQKVEGRTAPGSTSAAKGCPRLFELQEPPGLLHSTSSWDTSAAVLQLVRECRRVLPALSNLSVRLEELMGKFPLCPSQPRLPGGRPSAASLQSIVIPIKSLAWTLKF